MTNPLTTALQSYDEAARAAAAANKAKKEADAEKNNAKAAFLTALEEYELDSASATIDGEKVNFSKYEFITGHIQDKQAFREWAEQEYAEAYFEPETRPRGDLINALVRQLIEDGEPLPPGVITYIETRLSRTAKG